MSREFELKLSGGRVVVWSGDDGVDAARRYAAEHPGAAVVAWRPAHRLGLHIGLLPIVEAAS